MGRPQATAGAPASSASSGAVSQRARTGEHHDPVRLRVVARRGGQVDHLEVRRQLPEDPDRAGRAVVVERHERVVEDERRPAVLRDEADEAEAGGQVDLVQRSLGQLLDGDPVAALRGKDADVQRGVVDPDAPVARRR